MADFTQPDEDDYVHPELVNLAERLDDDTLAEMAGEVVRNYKDDEDSRQQWMSMHADWLRLYFQKDHPINPPWEGSSEESIPILAEACNQFHARAFKAMFPNRNIVKAVQVGMPDEQSKERAKRVGTHLSWQLMTRDKTYKKNKDRLLLSVPLHGSCFTKTYRCPQRDRNVTENVRATDFVVPYGTGPRDLEDIERKTHVIWMPINRAKKLFKKDFFIKEPQPWTERESTGSKNEVDQAHDDVMGLQEASYGDGTYAKILEQHRFWDFDGDDLADPCIVWVDATTEDVLRVTIRYDTDEAGGPTDDKEPVEYFTHYPFLENPDGFYGLGFGHLNGQLNTAINKLVRQTVDAGTLANAGNMSGFVDSKLSVKGGELGLQLGKFTKITGSTDDINRSIWQFKFPGPNASLMQITELLMARSDRLATVTEAVTGQTEKVMQPTTIMALIEQAMEFFSSVYETLLIGWESELDKHYRLNRKFMDPEEYFNVLDIEGNAEEASVSREDYEEDLQIKPVADPKMTSQQQKLAKAEAEWGWAIQNPLIVNSPMHFYQASLRYAEALEIQNIGEILPKPPVELPRVDDPFQENVGALSPVPMIPPVYPEQDHMVHIQAHQDLLQDEIYGSRLGPAGVAALEEHINAHTALMYGQTESMDGLERLAPLAGNGGIPQANGGPLPAGMAAGGGLGPGQQAEGPAGGPGGDEDFSR